jgi:NAD(P)-dependent dehydrogenase (short-subunit alcohol dehydrogenase family)
MSSPRPVRLNGRHINTTRKETTMLLENKNAIIYGAAGGIGSGVARTFAREGATVFLAGRTRETLDKLAAEITGAGGRAETAVVDALDEASVDAHAQAVADRAGTIDVSFNLITRGDVQGIPLADMSAADFLAPVTNGITTTFLTARAAARHMIPQGSGVILALNSGSAHGSQMMGGTGPADATIDTLIRNLAAELGPHGIRALGIWAAGIPDTLSMEKIAAVNPNIDEAAFQGILASLDQLRTLPRSPRLAQIADLAAFLASDRSGAVTGSFVNATGGMFPS